MSIEMLRFFVGVQGGSLYRIYVTSTDILCVRMGRGAIPTTGYQGGGLVGGAAAAQGYLEAKRQFDREVEEEGQMLAKRGAEGIRIYIKANKRGYRFDPDDLLQARLDHVGKWKRLFFCKPNPAFIVRSATGKLTFLLPEKKDVVIALHELQRLLGDNLEIGLNVEHYQKALKKYQKIRDS